MVAMVSAALLVGGCAKEGETKTVVVTESAEPVQNDVISSIKSQAKPLKTVDPTQPMDDLQPLKSMIGDARYVGLGENTHGSSEIFTMKFRLVKYLVTELGFTNFGMEEDWGSGLKLNEYIQTGKGNPREFLNLLYPTDEIVVMIDWMKEYNADPSNKRKIQFIGLDIKSLDQGVYQQVTDYVKRHYPDMLAEVELNYKELRLSTGSLQDYMKLSPEVRERFKGNAEKVVRLLEEKTKQADKKAETTELIWAKGTATAIRNFTSMLIPDDYPSMIKLHEQYMADHAVWAGEALDGKTMVWGHNIHVAKGIIDKELYPDGSGNFLKKRLGDQYIVMGSTTSEGDFTLFSEYRPDGNSKLSTEKIPQDVNSSNYMLGKVSQQMFLLDARHLEGPAKQWVGEKRPLLSLGGQLLPNAPVYFDASLREQFDILFHIRKTSPSHMK
ncbi:erythromycin esterase family protein [Paenibacillus chitinolyticus]|nr:erythromycin esterase family protein [Paenibacillus chitinolyticus]MCY9590594.1 erythromycin esterase family protein [Paenibacillus chitinolyticus]MCY9596411.1 erythromycin esterase family protein [Paenibacillus chitinolyticus]